MSTNALPAYDFEDKTDDGVFMGALTRFGIAASDVTIGRYFLLLDGDTDHVRRVMVRFILIPKPNTGLNVKALLYTVPAPTKQDLIDLGFRDTYN